MSSSSTSTAVDRSRAAAPPEEATAAEREDGVVEWYSPTRGYGFIRRADGTQLFVHHSFLRDRTHRRLAPGERVAFRVESGERGLQGRDVERLARMR